MDNEKFEERLARLERLERLENPTVKRPAFEQFVLRFAVALSLLQCVIVVVSPILYLIYVRDISNILPYLIMIPWAFMYSFALFVVFKRVHEI